MSKLWAGGLHARQFEMERLEEYLVDPPAEVILLTGPRNAGKSAFVKEVLRNQSENRQKICLDGRAAALTSTASVVAALRKASLRSVEGLPRDMRNPVVERVRSLARLMGRSNADILNSSLVQLLDLILPGKEMGGVQAIGVMVEILGAMIDQQASPGETPIIFIDQVNKLRDWAEGGDQQKEGLRLLMDFFIIVRLGGECVCHDLLCTD